jgi:HEAT repeat protein
MTTDYTFDEITQLFRVAFTSGDSECTRVALQAAQTTNQSIIKPCLSALATIQIPNHSAFVAIGRFGQLGLLLELFAQTDWETRAEVVKALRWIGGAEAMNALKCARDDEDDYVRLWAGRAVIALEGPPGTVSYDSGGPIELNVEPLGVLDDRGQVIAAMLLGNVDQSDLQIVATLVGHPSQRLRKLAQSTLQRGGRIASDSLFDVLAKREAPLTIEIVQLVGEMRDHRGIELLLKTALQAGTELRDACISTLPKLGSLDNPKVIESLIELLCADYINYKIQEVIKTIGAPVALPLLEAFANKPEIRRHQARLVAEVAGVKAIPVLIEALEDRYRAVRENAVRGLEILRGPVVDELLKLLENEPSEVFRRQAIRVLGRIGDPKSFKVVAAMIEHPQTSGLAVEALGGFPTDNSFKLLGEILRKGNLSLERHALKAIERFENAHPCPRQLIPLLIEALGYPTLRVRINAFEYLIHLIIIGTTKEAPTDLIVKSLIEVLSDHNLEFEERAISALVDISDISQEFLKYALTSARGVLRIRILQTLQRIDEKKVQEQRWREPSEPGLRSGLPADMEFQLLKPSLKPSPEVPIPISDNVNFSVTAPMMSAPEESFILGVWVHRGSNIEFLHRARDQQRGKDPHIATKGPVPLERGAILNVKLSIPDFGLDDLNDTIYWSGEFSNPIGNCTFSIKVPHNAETGTHLGEVRFLLGELRVAKLDFALEVGLHQTKTVDTTLQEERLSSAFASYASKDRNKVLGRIQGMLKMLPDLDVFLDVASLRSGENWRNRLSKEILSREIFFLFWSLAASKSTWVEKEWRTALDGKGLNFISPVPLISPEEVPPPTELSSLHFNEWTLAFEKKS